MESCYAAHHIREAVGVGVVEPRGVEWDAGHIFHEYYDGSEAGDLLCDAYGVQRYYACVKR